MPSASTPAACSSSNTSRARSHCLPFAHALISALYVKMLAHHQGHRQQALEPISDVPA